MSQGGVQTSSRARLVERLAAEMGFALVGVAAAEPSEHGEAVRAWIEAGKHGEMAYLADRLEERLDPQRLLPGARSVIGVADFYPPEGEGEGAGGDESGVGAREPACGRVARYAWGRDYHTVMKKRLHRMADALASRFPQEQFRCAVDTAPILEREHAQRAGLGWCGKHTLLIHPQFGSWMVLGEIVTTLSIQSSAEAGFPGPTVAPDDHCGTCTRCIDACPTGCITPHAVDATRCISYLTLEHRSTIDPTLHEAMGDWVAGCDVCQEVCPFNRMVGGTVESGEGGGVEGGRRGERPLVRSDYTPGEIGRGLPLLEVLGWTAEDRQRAFAGSALKRIKLEMLKRNALIAAGNHLRRHADAELLRRIEEIAGDADETEMVRLTARQVLDRLAR
jgi:epoxyqueuosine reductase